MNEFFKIDKRILDASDKALKLCKEQFENIEKITEYNQQKIQKAFIDNRISETHFGTSTGYGYGDIGRETLDKVWAQVLGAESALVRHNFTCGTHTLATALFGVLRPGDNMLCVSGTPYDTIHNVIGISGEGMGSLKEFGVNVLISDPLANSEEVLQQYNLTLTDINEISNLDALIIAVSHDFYKLFSLDSLNKFFNPSITPVLIDVKGLFEKDKAKNLNYLYWRL